MSHHGLVALFGSWSEIGLLLRVIYSTSCSTRYFEESFSRITSINKPLRVRSRLVLMRSRNRGTDVIIQSRPCMQTTERLRPLRDLRVISAPGGPI
jgi:hypothetical protein